MIGNVVHEYPTTTMLLDVVQVVHIDLVAVE